jgi:beta-carotene 15,15'-dioxygenase
MNFIKIFLKTPTWLTVIFGFSLLILQFYQESLSRNIQISIFIFLILLTGIPHGALDHLIQKKTDTLAHKKYDFLKFLAKYLLIMALYALAWFWFSGISFMGFLIISAWHFGETDLANAPKNALIWSFTRLLYGFYILAFMLLTHANEVSPIIERMIGSQNDILFFWKYIHLNFKQILYLLGLFFTTFFIVAQSEYFINFDKMRVLRLILILLISVWLPLLPAFALYFGGWHALCAFDSIHDYLWKDQQTQTLKLIYLNSLPFTILAIIFLGGFLWFCKNYTQQFDPFPILFIFISLITLPHLIITHEMNHDTK